MASQYVITLQMQHNCMQYSDVDHILSVSATILQWAIIGKIVLFLQSTIYKPQRPIQKKFPKKI